MNTTTSRKSVLPWACAALLTSMGAQAVPMSNPVLTGTPRAVYLETSPGVLTSVAVTAANVAAALSGAGNVELGRFGFPAPTPTTLSGDFAGTPVTLSGLTSTDWTSNGNALAQAYITGAATSIGATLTPAQMALALNTFFNFDLPGPGVLFSWQLISDPNVSDVNLIDGNVVVGLDGFLDATLFLNTIFGSLGYTAPAGSQASEVVKVTYQSTTEYVYYFDATPTGYQTADGSYNGRFSVPEPASLALLGIGIAGLGFMRRRKA